jgi:hypothetical protein
MISAARDSQTILRLTANALAATGLLDALSELEAHQEDRQWDAADALAAELLEQWPNVASVLVEVARLRARQGRHEEAMDLLYNEHVGQNVRLINYKLCVGLVG